MERAEIFGVVETPCSATLKTGVPCRYLAAQVVVGLGFCDRHFDLLIGHIDRYHRERREVARRRIEARERAEKERTHVVYYVRRPDGCIKIGTTSNLDSRLKSLRTVSPVELVGTEPGDRRAEQVMHQIFRELRADGEWFKPGKRLLAYLEQVRARPVAS